MTETLFPIPVPALLDVVGETEKYPLRRIFCVGRNYAAHAAEMGGEVDREAPWYFTKSLAAFCASKSLVPMALGTSNYHHEVELVVALGAAVCEATDAQAEAAIYGYAVGLDMTRRDRQQDGKDHRRPWDLGKDVENSAPMGAITKAGSFAPIDQSITMQVNDEVRQNATLADMVWSPVEIIKHLSRYYHLMPGDVIMTGTPAGVGPVQEGDVLVGQIDGLTDVVLTLKG